MLIVYIRSALAHFVSQKQNSSHFAACCRLLRTVYVLGFGLPVMWPLFSAPVEGYLIFAQLPDFGSSIN